MPRKSVNWRRWLFLPPVLIGCIALFVITQSRPPAARADLGGSTPHVRVLTAPTLNVVPIARGYGPVAPARVWSAVPQVAGRVIALHPKLQNGAMISAGELLVSIDQTIFKLTIAEIEAELAELEIQRTNTEASLRIERRALSLAEQELARFRQLRERGSVSASEAQEVESAALAAQGSVQNLENTLALIPAQRNVLLARKAKAERDLDNTDIVAPFDLRVAGRAVEVDQSVSVGQLLFEGDAVDEVEIVAQVAPGQLRHLVLDKAGERPDMAALAGQDLANIFGVTAEVRMDLGGVTTTWQAQLRRLSDTVDPATRTVGVVVAVSRPFEKAIPGERPPLSKGMFVEVILRGRPSAAQVVVPAETVEEGQVFVVDGDNRLRPRPVTIRFEQGGVSVIESGLTGGETVVLSDATLAIPGMRVRTEFDEWAANQLVTGAGGGQ